jgi:hypothetical protein
VTGAGAAVRETPSSSPSSPADETPDDRRSRRALWIAAALVGGAMAGLVVWQALVPRELLTGSNSVGVRSPVATVGRGHTLCVLGLSLPAGSGRVRFALGAQRPRVRVLVRVSAARASHVARATGAARPGSRIALDAAIPTTPATPASVPATACLTPLDGPVMVGGMAGLQRDQPPARLDGAALPARVAVWFLGPPGQRRSLLDSAGRIFSRAALFRPGIVGPWTYPLLLFVVAPLTWLLALWLMAGALRERRPRVHPAALIALIAFLNAATWALVTPPFEAPDEPDHFAYVQYLGETGHQPARGGPAPAFSSDQTLALEGLRTYSRVGLPEARPPWLASDVRHWERDRALALHRRDDGGGPSTASGHSPLYYGLLAPAYRAARSQSVFSQLTVARLVSALLGVVIALSAFGIVRELAPRERFAAVGAGLLVAFQPMVTFMAGAVNNDTGVNAAAALALYLTIRGLRRGPTWRLALALGATLAIAPLMKGTGLEVYPAILLGVVGIAWRHHRRADLRALGLGALAFAAVRGAWALVAPGLERPAGGGPGISATGSLHAALRMPGRYLEYLWETLLPRLPFMAHLFPQRWFAFHVYVREGWAAFGWLSIAFPKWVYVAIALAMLACGGLALALVVGAPGGAPPRPPRAGRGSSPCSRSRRCASWRRSRPPTSTRAAGPCPPSRAATCSRRSPRWRRSRPARRSGSGAAGTCRC